MAARRSQQDDDEAYARALQEEYRNEFITRQATLGGDGGSGEEDRPNNNSSSSNNNNHQHDPSSSNERSPRSDTGEEENEERRSSRIVSTGQLHNQPQHPQNNDTDTSEHVPGTSARKKKKNKKKKKKNNKLSAGEEWLSTHHPGSGSYQQQQQQQQTPDYTLTHPSLPNQLPTMVPLPPPYVDCGSSSSNNNNNNIETDDAESGTLVWDAVTEAFRYSSTGRSTASSSSAESTAPLTDSSSSDELLARRLQQELEDAELAQRMSLHEEQEYASSRVVQTLERQREVEALAAANVQRGPPRQHTAEPQSCLAKYGPLSICLLCAITLPLLFVFDVFSLADIPFLGDWFGDDFIGNDPWSGNNNVTIEIINGTAVPEVPYNAYRWQNDGTGLRLDILIAVSDDYAPFVETSIANWDAGYPIDSLTLFASRIPYELECREVTGKLKVCNGDYGDTRWRGLNEVLLSPRQNTIFSSTAKLNEFYLNYESDYQKLYTSCHEIGHGFGLPHWDEDFFNKDLGNCMDYTQNPEKSYFPDASNFLYLAQLYGGREVVNDAATPEDTGRRSLSSLVSSFFRNDPNDNETQEQHQDHIPLWNSRLLNKDGMLPGMDDIEAEGDFYNFPSLSSLSRRKPRKRQRVLLRAEHTDEVHTYVRDDGLIVIQRFMLVA